ncbi:MAG: M23 family metallopeptidase [Actinomycetota bacterium]|nr:M23 family metallopeptidase [Actinomycetota bacterium]
MKGRRPWRFVKRRRRLRLALRRLLALMVLLLPLLAVTPAGLPSAAGFLPGAGAKAGWSWPLVPRPAVVGVFILPARPWLNGHRGVDLAARAGEQVHSPAAGTVSFVRWVVDRPVLTILHADGIRSSFEPVDSPLAVGSAVATGDVVGTVSPNAHCPPDDSGNCLHWGVRVGQDYVDPLQFILDRRPSVLLPLDGSIPRENDRGQTMAEIPVIARPVTSVLIS